MAHVAAAPHCRFGVSYDRALFERHGTFPENLHFAEDSVFNARLLRAAVEIVWAPEVVTAHAYPSSAGEMLRDQYRRGRLRVNGHPAWRTEVVARALAGAPVAVWRASRHASPVPRGRLAAATPLVGLGAVAKAAGALVGGGPSAGADAERAFHRWVRFERRGRASRHTQVNG
jgi:hypothetical protein